MKGGNGTLSGGKGADTFELNYSASQTLSAVIEDLDPSEDKIVVNFDGNTTPQLTREVRGNDVVLRDTDGQLNVTPLILSEGLMKGASIRAQEITGLAQIGALSNHRYYWTQMFADSLKSPEIIGTTELLTANPQVNTVSNFVTGNDNANTITNNEYGRDARRSRRQQYATGDGNDTISGLHSTDTLSISGDDYTPVIVGNNIVVAVGTDSITLIDAANTGVQIHGTWSKVVILTEDNDAYQNTLDGATIQALGGNDSIQNGEGSSKVGANVSLNAGAGDDALRNFASGVTIDCGAGTDNVYNAFANNAVIYGGDGSYTINNWKSDSAVINAGSGNDFIENFMGDNVSIAGGSGNDTIISNWGDKLTINGGKGNDSIILDYLSENNLIGYAAGDGNDIIEDFNATATLSISGGEYVRSTVNNDIIVAVGDDSITLLGAASLSTLHIIGEGHEGINVNNMLITLTAGNDIYNNSLDGATIESFAGDDTIINSGNSVTIDTGTGNDIISLASGATENLIVYRAGDGFDTVNGFNETDTLKTENVAGDFSTLTSGNDIVVNVGAGAITLEGAATLSTVNLVVNWSEPRRENNLITLSDNNDRYSNTVGGVTIAALSGDDSIRNGGASVTVDSGDGNDYIDNDGASTTINGRAGNDTVYNRYTNTVTIDGGLGNDYIRNSIAPIGISDGETLTFVDSIVGGDSVSIGGGDDNDTIYNGGSFVTINGGTGNDRISLLGGAENNVIEYGAGDGNDTVWGYDANVSLRIGDGTGTYSSTVSGDDLIILVGTGSITLKDVREKPTPIILGESGSAGGNSGSSGGGVGGSASGGGSSGGSSGSSSGSSGNSNGSNSGGSSGRGTSSGIGNGSGNGGDGLRIKISTSNLQATQQISPNSNLITSQQHSSSIAEFLSSMRQTQPTEVVNQHVYSGGNQVIANYTSGEKIIFGDVYTGSFYDAGGNFLAGSSAGALVVQNAVDKVVDLSDAAGNSVIKAYAASSAGVIDGRGLMGFEVINGSAGGDVIYAGDGGSQLWGGADLEMDVLVGGNGSDIFIGGRTQGNDFFLNASSADMIHLNDAALSDIIATEENNGTIAVAFNTGNVVTVQSSEPLSAAFLLADGSSYRYHHANKSWQKK